MSKIKISLKLLYSRTETVEGRISELEGLWDYMVRGAKRQKKTGAGGIKRWGRERIFEGIMAICFSNWMKTFNLYILEPSKHPSRIYSKRFTPRHIIINVKIWRRRENLEAAREKHTVMYKGAAKRPATAFSSETTEDTSQ